jgi:hypothetical protein
MSAAPFERMPAQARAAAIAGMRGQPREAVRDAAREAVRQALFLVELVLELNVAAHEAIQLLGARCDALSWEWRSIRAAARLKADSPSESGRTGRKAHTTPWSDAVESLLSDLYLGEEARAHLERRFLDSTPSLFPDPSAAWARLRALAERLAEPEETDHPRTGSAAEARRRPGRSSRRPAIDLRRLHAASVDRAPEESAPIVEIARAAALEDLGDIDGAAAIAERRLLTQRVN